MRTLLTLTLMSSIAACTSSDELRGRDAIAEFRLMANTVSLGTKCTLIEDTSQSTPSVSRWQLNLAGVQPKTIEFALEVAPSVAIRKTVETAPYWIFDSVAPDTVRWSVNETNQVSDEFVVRNDTGASVSLADCK